MQSLIWEFRVSGATKPGARAPAPLNLSPRKHRKMQFTLNGFRAATVYAPLARSAAAETDTAGQPVDMRCT